MIPSLLTFKKITLSFSEKLWAHSEILWKVQTFPTDSTAPQIHSPASCRHPTPGWCICYSPRRALTYKHLEPTVWGSVSELCVLWVWATVRHVSAVIVTQGNVTAQEASVLHLFTLPSQPMDTTGLLPVLTAVLCPECHIGGIIPDLCGLCRLASFAWCAFKIPLCSVMAWELTCF